MMELLPKTLYIDFVAKRHFFAALSALSMAASLALFFIVGPNWSIDFTGGTEVEVRFQESTEIDEVRRAMASMGVGEDAVQAVSGEASTYLVRVQGASGANEAEVERVKSALAAAFGPDWINEFRVDAEVGTRAAVLYDGPAVQGAAIEAALAGLPDVRVQASPEENTFYVRLPGVAEQIRDALTEQLAAKKPVIDRADSVGPKVGGNLREAGLVSLLITMGLLLVYVAVRFDFSFAPGAVLCLFHDAILTVGVWVLFRQEFGLPMISATLTLVGYSLNDTIVVYDRIRENLEKYRKADMGKLINDSINQTLSRTIITSGATALALLPFLFLGGQVLNQFARAMLLGMFFGIYSTIYIASPLMLLLKENQDRILGLLGVKSAA
ncbi:MAG: protein translocase subunit SecF [Deltaproteobacteria bacterium]|nr:protein translocase subunit SecF [Deltaproteobacteria bacterium]